MDLGSGVVVEGAMSARGIELITRCVPRWGLLSGLVLILLETGLLSKNRLWLPWSCLGRSP